jgi:hypothetical protein
LAGKFAFAAFSAAAAADALVGVGGGERNCGGEAIKKKRQYQDACRQLTEAARDCGGDEACPTNTREQYPYQDTYAAWNTHINSSIRRHEAGEPCKAASVAGHIYSLLTYTVVSADI